MNGRTLDIALRNAERLRQELPHLIQPSGTDIDMVILADEIKRLRAKLAEAERDAARYRWLRDEQFRYGSPPLAAIVWKANYNRQCSDWVNSIDAAHIDAAIDAAMQQEPPRD